MDRSELLRVRRLAPLMEGEKVGLQEVEEEESETVGMELESLSEEPPLLPAALRPLSPNKKLLCRSTKSLPLFVLLFVLLLLLSSVTPLTLSLLESVLAVSALQPRSKEPLPLPLSLSVSRMELAARIRASGLFS